MISINMKNVGKSFDSKTVLKDVSFESYEGEIFGLLGPSGAGKTTIINILTKQLDVDSGEAGVSVDSTEIGLLPLLAGLAVLSSGFSWQHCSCSPLQRKG